MRTEYFFYAPIVGDNKEPAEIADMMNKDFKKKHDCDAAINYLKEQQEYFKDHLKYTGMLTQDEYDALMLIRINSRTVH